MKRLLAQLHEWGLRLDRFFTRPVTLARPVISVGNIAMGGRAKTPFVIEIARELKAQGYLPIVLTRGYGRENREDIWLVDPSDGLSVRPEDVGDEALEIFWRSGATVLIGANRVRNAQAFLRKTFPARLRRIIFILDDGFQHWALTRHWDFVLVNPGDRTDSVFPLGYLRENSAALSRAQLVWERGRDFEKHARLRQLPGPQQQVAALTTRAPDPGYRAELTAQHAALTWIELADHANRETMLRALLSSSADTIWIGAKEAVKLLAGGDLETFFREGALRITLRSRSFHLIYVECELEIKDRPAFVKALLAQVLQ